ncbi:MAG: glycosyltransferase family 4 protein [Pseudoflavonifractor sp.]|nr:glycosyltransferase family 4 protein [Alloprevotella sp.]MCM1116072.1 glycosyltransferase family 4 protein [Pseudoflavonifractor sp.]
MTYALIFALLLILEIVYFKIANHFNIIDKPNLRSSHTSVTLRGGGIVFLFGAWLYAAFFGLGYGWFLTGLTLIALISFTDDIHSLPDSLRLVVQFAAMFMMFYQFGILNLHDWWIVLIALIVCVGITNAYNFMDGINGITGGYSIAVLLPLIYLNTKMEFIDMPYLYVTGLSLIVFCFFNFRKKAKCFAGDVGSITIAFILLFALGKLILLSGDFSYITLLAVYGADSVLTICHRIQLHENLGEAHRKHAYQLMANELKIPHVNVSIIYMALQLAISFGMIFCPINHYIFLGATIVMLMILYIIFMKRNYHLHEAYLKSKAQA